MASMLASVSPTPAENDEEVKSEAVMAETTVRAKSSDASAGVDVCEAKEDEPVVDDEKCSRHEKPSESPSPVPTTHGPSDEQHSAKDLFVGNLSLFSTEDRVRNYFCRFGQVLDVRVMYHPDTSRSRRFGFVTFADAESLKRALASGEELVLDGKTLQVSAAYIVVLILVLVTKVHTAVKRHTEPTYGKIFVGNLCQSHGEADVRAHFSAYGHVAEVCIPSEALTGRHRGFAFVTFREPESADLACAVARQTMAGGWQVEVKKARQRGRPYRGKPSYCPRPSCWVRFQVREPEADKGRGGLSRCRPSHRPKRLTPPQQLLLPATTTTATNGHGPIYLVSSVALAFSIGGGPGTLQAVRQAAIMRSAGREQQQQRRPERVHGHVLGRGQLAALDEFAPTLALSLLGLLARGRIVLRPGLAFHVRRPTLRLRPAERGHEVRRPAVELPRLPFEKNFSLFSPFSSQSTFSFKGKLPFSSVWHTLPRIYWSV